jgi:hypothetical protein
VGALASCALRAYLTRSSSKPVPEGALLWYLDAADLTTTAVMPRVTARINKVHYGASSLLPWIPFIPEMVGRPRIFGPAGDLMTPGGWCPIVAKVCFCWFDHCLVRANSRSG